MPLAGFIITDDAQGVKFWQITPKNISQHRIGPAGGFGDQALIVGVGISEFFFDANNSMREDGYHLVKASLTYEHDENWQLTFFIKNLGNKTYLTHGESILDPASHRYIMEDVRLGLSFLVSVGKWAGGSDPRCQAAFLAVSSAVSERDFYAEGRTLENLGLDGLSPEKMARLMQDGIS